LQCIENPNLDPKIFNIGNNNETTVLELANLINKITNANAELVFLPALKEGDMKRRLPDITKMKQLLNRPMTSLEDGIKEILKDTKFIL